MKDENTSKFLTPKQVADRLQINYHKILDLIHLGELDAYKIGSVFRISETQFNKFLVNNRYKSYWKSEL